MFDDETEVPSDNGNSDSSSQEAEGEKSHTIPYSRFKEVNDKLKEAKADLEKVKGGTQKTDQETQAKQYLKGLLAETLHEQELTKKQKEAEEQTKFEESVDEICAANTEVSRKDLLKFLEDEGDDYVSVAAAFKGYQRLHSAEKTGEENAKTNLSKRPKLPSNEGEKGDTTEPPPEDKHKSIMQIAAELTRDLSKKK